MLPNRVSKEPKAKLTKVEHSRFRVLKPLRSHEVREPNHSRVYRILTSRAKHDKEVKKRRISPNYGNRLRTTL